MNKIKGLIRYLIKEFKYIFSREELITSLDWDKHWLTGKAWVPNRLYIICDIIKSCINRKASVADMGAGGGDLLKLLLEKQIITKDSLGVDVSESGIARIKNLGLNGMVADVTSKDFNLPRQYDFITLVELVEHIRDCEEVIIKLKSKSLQGIIVTTPNLGYFPFRLRLLFGRFPHMPHLPPREHVRFWTVVDFKIWAHQLGFKVMTVKGCSGFPTLFKIWPSLFANDVLYWVVYDGNKKDQPI